MGRSSQYSDTGGCPRGRQENDITKQGRFAACLCAISVALIFGGFGGAVAAADTEKDASLSDTHDLGEPDPQVGTGEVDPTGHTPEPGLVGTVPDLLGALDGEHNGQRLFGSDQEETNRKESPQESQEEPGGETAGLTGPMAIGVTIEPDGAAAPSAEEDNNNSDTAAATDPEERNEPEVTVSHSPATEPSQEVQAPAADPPPPPADPPAEAPPPIQPAAADVATVEESPAPAQAGTVQLMSGAAPTSDIVTALAYLFIALTDDNVSLVAIPENLLSLLGFTPRGDGTTVSVKTGGIGGSLFAGGLYSAVRTQLASSGALQAGWPEILRALSDSGSLSSRGVTHSTARGFAASGAVEQHSVGLKAVLADGLVPEKVRSVFQHTVDAFLAPLSLVVLAALASPGVAGLVLVAAAGVFVGYRQAKAASILRAVGIARLVKSGPLGVVRSGGLVALHPRTSYTDNEQPRPKKRHLESVA